MINYNLNPSVADVAHLFDSSAPLPLLHKHKVNGKDEADEGCDVVPLECFSFEHKEGED